MDFEAGKEARRVAGWQTLEVEGSRSWARLICFTNRTSIVLPGTAETRIYDDLG